MCLLFHCRAGVKLLADTLHDVLTELGICANADDSPSTWPGVTCAENGVDILELVFEECYLEGNKLLYMTILLICVSSIIIITCCSYLCYYHH